MLACELWIGVYILKLRMNKKKKIKIIGRLQENLNETMQEPKVTLTNNKIVAC